MTAIIIIIIVNSILLSLRYHAVFIMCELHFCGSPDYVGITVKRDVLPLSYLPVRYPVTTGQSFRHNFTTCFPVMHSHYSNKLELLQVNICFSFKMLMRILRTVTFRPNLY